MATEKKFAVAGVSTLNGKTKIRFANDSLRIKILAKNGHENIDLINLPHEMTKPEIVAYMKSMNYGADKPDVQAAMDLVMKRNPVTVQAETPVAAETVTTEEPVVA